LKLIPFLAAAAVLLTLSCGTVDMAKKYPHMVADADPIAVGTIDAALDRMFSTKLNRAELEIFFYPRLNAVALEFKYELLTYRQFWDAANRQQFATALELYKADFAARNLINKYKKTRAIYGKVKGQTEWEAFKHARTHNAYPVIELGYRFNGETPFFTSFMRPAKEQSKRWDGSDPDNSPAITLYFTRAQADELVQLFDQSYLMELLAIKGTIKSDEPLAVDDY